MKHRKILKKYCYFQKVKPLLESKNNEYGDTCRAIALDYFTMFEKDLCFTEKRLRDIFEKRNNIIFTTEEEEFEHSVKIEYEKDNIGFEVYSCMIKAMLYIEDSIYKDRCFVDAKLAIEDFEICLVSILLLDEELQEKRQIWEEYGIFNYLRAAKIESDLEQYIDLILRSQNKDIAYRLVYENFIVQYQEWFEDDYIEIIYLGREFDWLYEELEEVQDYQILNARTQLFDELQMMQIELQEVNRFMMSDVDPVIEEYKYKIVKLVSWLYENDHTAKWIDRV